MPPNAPCAFAVAGAELLGVDDRLVAGDDAARLELLHALVDGRRAQADLLGDLRERRPPLGLEQRDDRQVGVVQPFHGY